MNRNFEEEETKQDCPRHHSWLNLLDNSNQERINALATPFATLKHRTDAVSLRNAKESLLFDRAETVASQEEGRVVLDGFGQTCVVANDGRFGTRISATNFAT